MNDAFSRIVEDLSGRLHGPFKFRMASAFAIRDGCEDTRSGREYYVTAPGHRRELMNEYWVAMEKALIAPLLNEVIYRLVVFRRIYLGQASIVAPFLALVLYILPCGSLSRPVGQE
jgi:hypothetical protein